MSLLMIFSVNVYEPLIFHTLKGISPVYQATGATIRFMVTVILTGTSPCKANTRTDNFFILSVYTDNKFDR